MSSDSYYCTSCGKEHTGLPTDWAFRLPDEVHVLSYLDRYTRSRHNADLCALDEQRYFLRGLILIPFSESDGAFGWGIWVEVSREVHDLYLANFHDDISSHPRQPARLANDIPSYSPLKGVEVEIEFRGAGDRPVFWFGKAVVHALAHEQRGGISRVRHHDILNEMGYFEEDEEA